jgi:hypothetical protein
MRRHGPKEQVNGTIAVMAARIINQQAKLFLASVR